MLLYRTSLQRPPCCPTAALLTTAVARPGACSICPQPTPVPLDSVAVIADDDAGRIRSVRGGTCWWLVRVVPPLSPLTKPTCKLGPKHSSPSSDVCPVPPAFSRTTGGIGHISPLQAQRQIDKLNAGFSAAEETGTAVDARIRFVLDSLENVVHAACKR